MCLKCEKMGHKSWECPETKLCKSCRIGAMSLVPNVTHMPLSYRENLRRRSQRCWRSKRSNGWRKETRRLKSKRVPQLQQLRLPLLCRSHQPSSLLQPFELPSEAPVAPAAVQQEPPDWSGNTTDAANASINNDLSSPSSFVKPKESAKTSCKTPSVISFDEKDVNNQANRGLKRAHINRGLSQAAALSSSRQESPSPRRKKKDEAKAEH